MRDLLQKPSNSLNDKRLFLEIFFEYLRQIFLTHIFTDCSSHIRENWLPRLFNRAKLFLFEIGDRNSDIGLALNELSTQCQQTLSHFSLHMRLYTCNFNSITINPLPHDSVEIRFHFYFTFTLGRPLSPLFDEALNNSLLSRMFRAAKTDRNPHLQSSFVGNDNID